MVPPPDTPSVRPSCAGPPSPLPLPFSLFFLESSRGISGPSNVHVWALGLSCETLAPFGRPLRSFIFIMLLICSFSCIFNCFYFLSFFWKFHCYFCCFSFSQNFFYNFHFLIWGGGREEGKPKPQTSFQYGEGLPPHPLPWNRCRRQHAKNETVGGTGGGGLARVLNLCDHLGVWGWHTQGREGWINILPKGGRPGQPARVSGRHEERGRQSSPTREVRPGEQAKLVKTVNIQVRWAAAQPGQDRRLPSVATHSRLQRATSVRSRVGIVLEDGSGVAIDWVTGRSYSSARRRLNVQSGQRESVLRPSSRLPSECVDTRQWEPEESEHKLSNRWNASMIIGNLLMDFCGPERD